MSLTRIGLSGLAGHGLPITSQFGEEDECCVACTLYLLYACDWPDVYEVTH